MNIKIKNDCKEKYQSFEATVEVALNDRMFYGDAIVVGLGADEAEARANLNKALDGLRRALTEQTDEGDEGKGESS